jgi:hypothetical protein
MHQGTESGRVLKNGLAAVFHSPLYSCLAR